MSAGDFNSADRLAIDNAIRQAELLCRFEFSVFVGESEGETRHFATSLHNSLVAPARSVMIMVDPTARAIEVVTGGEVRRTLSDREVELAALQMQTAFAADDYVGGLTSGIAMLAEHAKN